VREEGEARPVAAAAQAGDEVGARRLAGVELALDAVLLEVAAQELGGGRLVARRIDRVDADQLPEELDGLLPQRRDGAQSDSLARAVSVFRTSQSSG
jgi:hypothetical protein